MKLIDRIVAFDDRFGDRIIDGIVDLIIVFATALIVFAFAYHFATAIGDDPRYDIKTTIERGKTN